ncbi:MAG: DnaD domain protein [Chloroflexi bacterium]|nr:DnaD domain protein [Chloroflexota bacterium]
MSGFTGYPEGASYTPVPDLFFSDVLALVDDASELKLVLYLFWEFYHQRGSPRYITLGELADCGVLLSALPGEDIEDKRAELQRAVELAVDHELLLRLELEDADGSEVYLFINSAPGRRWVREVRAGRLQLESQGRVVEPVIRQKRPNIYTLYEHNIGLLTPLMADTLKEASETYPEEWITSAFRIAVERNARNWRYINAILQRWDVAGKMDTYA